MTQLQQFQIHSCRTLFQQILSVIATQSNHPQSNRRSTPQSKHPLSFPQPHPSSVLLSILILIMRPHLIPFHRIHLPVIHSPSVTTHPVKPAAAWSSHLIPFHRILSPVKHFPVKAVARSFHLTPFPWTRQILSPVKHLLPVTMHPVTSQPLICSPQTLFQQIPSLTHQSNHPQSNLQWSPQSNHRQSNHPQSN